MNIEIECERQYRSLEFVGDLPEPLRGVHRHSRSFTFAGAWNAAVELLVANRFDLDLHPITIQFSPSEPKVCLDLFLRAGGFDESLGSLEETKSEFSLRLFEISGDTERYAKQMARILSSTMSPRLSMKMNLRQGIPPADDEDNSTSVHEKQRPLESAIQTTELTLCVTFGEVSLAEQFFESYTSHVPKDVDVHLVACCFQSTPEQIHGLLEQHQLPFQSVKILPESWGHEQGERGNIGPWYQSDAQRHGVSWGRSVLHRAAALFSPTDTMWILDDDVLFQEDSFLTALQQLDVMKEKGCKVGIGAILGDAPLPPPYLVRTQTIDFFYSRFLKQTGTSISPPSDMVFHDMHHDLSTQETFHLEFPIGVGRALEYSEFNAAVLQGQSLTRKVHTEWENQKLILARGGNTLVNGKEVLLQFSNMAPNLGGVMCRRGDTLWSMRVHAEHPEWIQNIQLALIQQRQEGFDFGNLAAVRGDILGSMLVRYHGQPEGDVGEILFAAFNREARLISNLKRTLALLGLMEVKSSEQKHVGRLLDSLEQTPWPENLAEHLKLFINTYPLDAEKFKQAQGE
tara:strand:- start:216 stop:1928 length:1713 start_codon:yes stop_codon:yes gene_type:complete